MPTITGILKKFEPLESGELTVTMKVPGDQIQAVVDLYRKEVMVRLAEPDIEIAITEDALFEIRDLCRRVVDLAEEKLATVPPVPRINSAEVMEKFDEVITELGSGEVQAPDEFPATHDAKIDMMAPENEFYGEKDKKDAD